MITEFYKLTVEELEGFEIANVLHSEQHTAARIITNNVNDLKYRVVRGKIPVQDVLALGVTLNLCEKLQDEDINFRVSSTPDYTDCSSLSERVTLNSGVNYAQLPSIELDPDRLEAAVTTISERIVEFLARESNRKDQTLVLYNVTVNPVPFQVGMSMLPNLMVTVERSYNGL